MIAVDLAGTPDAWTFHQLPEAMAALGVPARHVVHAGAHLGEEVPDYRAAGFEQITLIEPDPNTCAQLRAKYPDLTVYQAACDIRKGTATLHRSRVSVFTSLLNPRKLSGHVVVSTVRLCDVQGDANVAVIDTQGTELQVLQHTDLSRLDLVIIETQGTNARLRGASAPSAAYWPDVAGWMAGWGWEPAIQWRHERQDTQYATYSDTLFVPSAEERAARG